MKIVSLLTIFSFCAIMLSAQPALRTKQFNLEEGIALQGYDPVAYHLLKKAIQGKKEFAFTIEGVTYFMSSAANKELFSKNYKMYEPQYGGWCAYAMGDSGEKVEVDPGTFKVESGKLYLFYNSFFNNTLPKWNKDESNLRQKADKNWAAIFK